VLGLCALASLASAQTAAPEVAVKAAFLYNFAKFTQWPGLPAAAPIGLCVAGQDRIAASLAETVRGQTISGHALEVHRPADRQGWQSCQLLFIADADEQWVASALGGITMQPVLTVSDNKGFSQSGGIIELYVEDGRVRFAINIDAAERSGLQLSSRLLGLAKVVRSNHVR
jgi:hypothetical protein